MKWIRWLAVVALVAVGGAAVYVSTVGQGTTQAAASELLTSSAQRTDVSQTSASTGTVSAAASYGLSFGEDPYLVDDGAPSSETSWTVEEVVVEVGDRVTAGQRLASADTADLEADLAQVRADLALADLSLAQAQQTLDDIEPDLRAQLASARDAVEVAELQLRTANDQLDDANGTAATRQAKIGVIQARDALRQARQTVSDLRAELASDHPDETIAVGDARSQVDDLTAQVADLQDQIERAVLGAPVDGVVAEIAIAPGLTAPAATSAIVVDGSSLQVVADVVESDIASVAVGQSAVVGIDALGIDVPGTVTSIAPSTDGGTSSVVTFPVTVTLDEPDASVRSGMSADVSITIAEATGVVAVPVAALQGFGGSYGVEVVLDDGTTELRPVSVGLVTETLAEVTSGVEEGEEVVVGTAATQVTTDDDSSGGFPAGGPAGGFPAGGFVRGG
jgi:RND family efflux transporter MFP subunit